MAEIATYTMIKTKTSYGSTGTECPPKKIIKTISSYISIANESSYGDNEAVKLEDISASAYTFTVANNSKSIGAAGGNTSAVDFTSYKIVNGTQTNVSYSLTSTLPSWLTWNSSTRTFNASNNLGAARSFTATFTQSESGKTVTASVYQAAVSQAYTFTVDGSASASLAVSSDGGTTTSFTFVSTVTTNGTTTNVAYSLTSTLPSWLSWNSTNRQFTVAANTGVERTATATFTQTGSGKTVTITIVQGEGEIVYVFTANPTALTVDSPAGNTNSISIVSTKTPPGGSVTNVSYSIASGTLPGWLIWNAGAMNFSVTANTSSSSRAAEVQFVQSESGKAITITVTQAGTTYVDWRFNIAGETVVNDTIGSDGGTLTYYVTSTKDGIDHGFRLTTSSGFMTPTQTGTGSQNITVTVSANTSSTSRTDWIEYRQYDSESTIRINITQSGKAADQYVLQFTDGTTTAKSGTIPAKYSSNVNLISGGIESYKITSSGQEAVSYTYTKPSWITSVEIDEDMVLVTGFSENTSTSSRSGSIVITQSGSNNKLTINVTQSGKIADAYVFTVDGSTSTIKTISASGGNVTVSVVSTKNDTTQDWSITNISTQWLTAIKENSNVKLTASSNYTSTSRTGIITLTQAGSNKTATITVNQQVSNEWTYTFEPVESSKNKPTKVTTGRSDFGLDTTYTMYSYKQRSLNGVIVDETQVGVNVEYVVEYPSEHNCTISSISADKTKWMIVLQLSTSLTTVYGTFTATQVDSNKVFEIDFMQVGDTDYRVGTYKLQKTSSSDTLWNGTDLIVYKEGSSDKTKGSQLLLLYVEINIDSDKITQQGYTLVSRTGTATSDRFIGRYSCPYRLRQSSTWFVSRFESEDPYGRLYFIFPENTGASRSATVAIDQYIPSVEITGCEVYENSPQTFSFTVTQHAAT